MGTPELSSATGQNWAKIGQLSLAHGRATTGNAQGKERVLYWLRRGMRKSEKKLEMFIFTPYWEKEVISPSKWGGKRQFRHIGLRELLLGISSRGRSVIGKKNSGVLHFLGENPEKARVGCPPSSKISIQKAHGVTCWVEARRDWKVCLHRRGRWSGTAHRNPWSFNSPSQQVTP